jgi:hypothetical protein
MDLQPAEAAKITLRRSSTSRIAAMVLSSSSWRRSTPWISVPMAGDSGRSSNWTGDGTSMMAMAQR